MKEVIIFLSFFLITGSSFSQNIRKSVKNFWWRIEENCFAGTSISRHNGLFMSTANNNRVGSIYTIRRSLGGRMLKADPYRPYDELRKLYINYPDPSVNPSVVSKCAFELKLTGDDTIRISDKIPELAGLGSIDAELLRILKSSSILKVAMDSWGYDAISRGSIEDFFSSNFLDNSVNSLRNGKRYVVLTALWVEGVKIDFNLDKNTATRVKALVETNLTALKEAGITLDLRNETVLATSINYDHRFYPFFQFGRITREGEVKTLVDTVLEEVDFSEFNSDSTAYDTRISMDPVN